MAEQMVGHVAGTRVFFGHQSVGQNVLDGVRSLAGRGEPVPVIQDAYIGENEQPELKIQDFDSRLRAGPGEEVDVAMMKLCYIDVTAKTDVAALFETYRATMAALGQDYPEVTFVHVTVPLTTERSGLSKLRARLTGNDRFGPDENVTRERLNTLIRDTYADQHVFDLAAVESTRPDGSRVTGRHDGSDYFALYDGHASDLGHLNAAGAEAAARAWLAAVTRAAGTAGTARGGEA